MDYIRFSFIAALAIVSYLLLLAWNEDYAAQPRQPVETQVATNEGSSDLPQTLPEAGSAATTTAEDIPQVQNSAPPAQAETPEPQADSGNVITISTPVHQATIDLRGGDIVDLALPRYPTSLDTPNDPFVLLENDARVYTSQSGLIGPDGPDGQAGGRPLYRASQGHYELAEGNDVLTVDLVHETGNGTTITKRFTFSAEDYLIQVQFLIDNASDMPFSANLFGQLKRGAFPDPSNAGGLGGVRTFLGGALFTEDDPYVKVDFDDMDDGRITEQATGGWVAFSQHYFLGAWIPNPEASHTYTLRRNNAGQYIMGFVSPQAVVPAGGSQTLEADFWAGPKDQYRLDEISPNLDLTIDYGFLWFIASPIFWLLTQINGLIGNFGWSIIALTIVIKLLFSKLSATSYRSMAKMRRLTPQIQQLKERHGDDKQKLMQAQMELWKKEKVNPMGGCLPMLLQMPVLIGIYWVLNESVELRHAHWILWYDDLSVMDPYFVLPLIMGASMFISQLMTPMTTADPMQAKIMKFMPVVFTVFFLWFPAGLVLYWLVSNVCNIGQQWYINKKVNEAYQAKGT